MHPCLAGVAVFMVAFTEVLAVVGLAVPGAVLMVWTGSLIATGRFPSGQPWPGLWPEPCWGMDSAIGSVSTFMNVSTPYGLFIGIRNALNREECLLNRHGGKSIFLGRFVGPIRPILPVVADMLDMPSGRFVIFNILSALIWAPAYLLPGMARGDSLAMASDSHWPFRGASGTGPDHGRGISRPWKNMIEGHYGQRKQSAPWPPGCRYGCFDQD